MKNLKVSLKIALSYTIIIVLFMVVSIITIVNVTNTKTSLTSFYNNPYIVHGMASQVKTEIESMQKNIYIAISAQTDEDTNNAIASINESDKIIEEKMVIIRERFLGDKKWLTSLDEGLSDLKTKREQVLAFAKENKIEEAFNYMEEEADGIVEVIHESIEEIVKFSNDRCEKLISKTSYTTTFTIMTVIIMSLFCIVISIILCLYITKSITKPLSEIGDAANELSNGNLNAKISYHSKDEIGEVADYMRNTVSTLSIYIKDIAASMKDLENGNLNTKLKANFKGDFIEMRNSIVNLISSLNETFMNIEQSADQVSSSSEQVSGGAQALSQGTAEQASAVEELAATIGEISNQIQNNAQNAEQVSELASNVGNEMTQTNEKMQEMISAMNDISVSSSEISKIIKTIEDIAFQTNILALNAAVEAARAGEAGKGFAVVADEVRNLASKSAEASKNTSALIETSVRSVKNGTHIADEAAQAMLSAVDGAKKVTETINHISDASKLQASAVVQVTQGIDQISSVVQINSATAQESAATSQELSGQAQILKQMISKFKLQDGMDFSNKIEITEPKIYNDDQSMLVALDSSKY